MMKVTAKLTAIIFLLSLALLTTPVHAVTISASIPGANGGTNLADCAAGTTNSASCNPAAFVNDFYSFALAISGILAFGAMIYGGVKYMLAAGNPSAQHEGKEWVQSALLGLLLLAGAYLILNTVNPALTTLQLPTLASSTTPATPAQTSPPSPQAQQQAQQSIPCTGSLCTVF